MKSPFKFLDAYTFSDKDEFFGRYEEEEMLYQQLRVSSVILLYGLSGTGKTSLVQSGLSKYFDGPDWYPFFIRKEDDINKSLENTLKKAINFSIKYNNIDELIDLIFFEYSRPIYLIFDQFEEVFTLSESYEKSELEISNLLININSFLQRNIPCKVIFIIREEFIGQLYKYEDYLPILFDFRVRVEPMNSSKIKDVIEKSFKLFNIESVNQPKIVENLLKGNATSQLAFLQVYLDKLWKSAYKKYYKNIEWERESPSVNITNEIITEVGDVNKVLENFLDEQKNKIVKEFNIKIEEIDSLLGDFVTDEGTKRPIEKKSTFNHPENLIIEKFISLKLIREDDRFYELSHDALAGIILGMQTQEQKLVKRITRSVCDDFESYKQGNSSDEWLLTNAKIIQFDTYKEQIENELEDTLKLRIRDFITASKIKVEAERRDLEDKNRLLMKQQLDLERQNSELKSNEIELDQKNKELESSQNVLTKTNRTLKKTNNQQKLALTAIGILLAGLIGFIIWGYNSYKENKINLNKYRHEKANQLKNAAKDYAQTKSNQGYKDALEVLSEADTLIDDPEIKRMILEYSKKIKR